MDPFTDLAPALARLMAARGLTQVELARRSGVTQPAISAYLSGKRPPTLANLGRLLRGMGADLVDLQRELDRIVEWEAQIKEWRK